MVSEEAFRAGTALAAIEPITIIDNHKPKPSGDKINGNGALKARLPIR
jgi:hypothetical protein